VFVPDGSAPALLAVTSAGTLYRLALPGAGGLPGMPRTGAGAGAFGLGLGLLGVALAAMGLCLRRRARQRPRSQPCEPRSGRI
jgi:hypothetical protein